MTQKSVDMLKTRPVESNTVFSQETMNAPFVICDATRHWPARDWTLGSLANTLNNQTFPCRLMPVERYSTAGNPAWEAEGLYIRCKLSEFKAWCEGEAGENNPLLSFCPREFSGYIDYKYMAEVFKDFPHMLKEVDWRTLGLDGIDGLQSTIWIGSSKASTPCHFDTYGFNLVAQIQGRKQWVLFPPEESHGLYPTRIPYEESSIFSQVDLACPDLISFPLFKNTHPVVITLEPGQVLYVPRHWWHYVSCADTAISINTWVDIEPGDSVSRLHEAVTRALASSLIPYLAESAGGNAEDKWVNPTEEIETATSNLQYVRMALIQKSKMEFLHCKQTEKLASNSYEDSTPDYLPCTSEHGPPTMATNVRMEHSIDDSSSSGLRGTSGGDNELTRGIDIPCTKDQGKTKMSVVDVTSESNTPGVSTEEEKRPFDAEAYCARTSETCLQEMMKRMSHVLSAAEQSFAFPRLAQLSRALQGSQVHYVVSPFHLSCHKAHSSAEETCLKVVSRKRKCSYESLDENVVSTKSRHVEKSSNENTLLCDMHTKDFLNFEEKSCRKEGELPITLGEQDLLSGDGSFASRLPQTADVKVHDSIQSSKLPLSIFIPQPCCLQDYLDLLKHGKKNGEEESSSQSSSADESEKGRKGQRSIENIFLKCVLHPDVVKLIADKLQQDFVSF